MCSECCDDEEDIFVLRAAEDELAIEDEDTTEEDDFEGRVDVEFELDGGLGEAEGEEGDITLVPNDDSGESVHTGIP